MAVLGTTAVDHDLRLAQLEPLLPRVQKPARYIGCEDGAQPPEHDPVEDGVAARPTPTPTRSGCPTRACRSSTRSSTSAPTPSPSGPTPRGPTSRRCCGPRASRCSRSTPTGRPATSTSSPSTCRPSSSTRTSSTASTWPACRCGPPTAAPSDPLIGAGGHCTYNPEPLADFVDFFVLGDGEEVVARDHRGGRRVEGRTASADRDDRAPRLWPASRASTSRRCTSVTYDGPPHRVGHAPPPRRARAGREAHDRRPRPSGPTRSNQLVPLTEVVHDRLNVEVFRGCTRGCRFCQAGMITRPVRERPAEQVRTMITEGLRRTGYDEVALTSLSTADFSGIEDVVGGDHGRRPGCGDVSVSLPSLRVDAFTVGIAGRDPARPPHRAHVRARGRHVAHAPGHQQAHPRGGPLRRGRVRLSQGWRRMKLYFLTGLPTETDEDTLGIATLARNCVEIGRKHHKNPSVTVSVGGFVPKPFTPFQWFGQNTREELTRKVHLLRDDAAPRPGRAAQVARPEGDRRRGHRVPRRPPARPGHRGRCGAAAARSRSGPSTSTSTSGSTRSSDHGLPSRRSSYRHRTEDEVLPWDHLSAGLHKDFLWQDWRDALAEVGLADCRWTPCYDCGACTGYGIEHVVASADAARRRQPGHRPGPRHRRRGAGRSSRPGPIAGARPVPLMRVRLRFTKLGKVRFTSHRDLARIWERALRRAEHPGRRTPRGSRPGPSCTSGWPCPPATSRWAEYLDVDLGRRAPPSTRPTCPPGSTPVPARRHRRHRGGAGRGRARRRCSRRS